MGFVLPTLVTSLEPVTFEIGEGHDMTSKLRKARIGVIAVALAMATGGTASAVSVNDEPKPPSKAAPDDMDGDGLPDDWEENGYDADGDGTIDVDLPAMGARKDHKDIFVEMDYMPAQKPGRAELDRIVQIFRDGPVSNPDGNSGINLHLDGGPGIGGNYDLGGGNEVGQQQHTGQNDVQALRQANFDSKRSTIFRYMVWADNQSLTPAGNVTCSSGLAWGFSTFEVTLGPAGGSCYDPNDAGYEDKKVGTFVHELGHTLGLQHGGMDEVNNKPNYLSVMNYSYQLDGVIREDNSRYFGYSAVVPYPLDENSLHEPAGLGASAAGWRAVYYCGNNVQTTAFSAKENVDWNCDGSYNVGVRTSVNNEPPTGTRFETLRGQNDWERLVYRVGGSNRQLDARERAAMKPVQELTAQEWERRQAQLRAVAPR